MGVAAATRRLAAVLEQQGILLVHDAELPSATAIVVGEPVRGSWWAHPQANEIFDAMQPLDDIATRVKLVRQKMTFVHTRLWPELIAVGSSGAPWQKQGLSSVAQDALSNVTRRRNAVTTTQLLADADTKERRRVIHDLEVRLLVHTEEVHTDSGTHAKYLQSWRGFQRRRAPTADIPKSSAAQGTFERIVAGWPNATGKRAPLPWPTETE